MNWDMLSAIGEIFGAAAVFVTLIYLTVQTKQNTASIQASTRQAIAENDQQFLLLIVKNPQLTELRYKPELNDDEKIQLSMYLVAFFRMRENLWRQYHEGVLDEATWMSYRNAIPAFASPRVRHWLNNDTIARMFDSEFISLARELIAGAPDSERPIWLSAFD